MKFEYKRQLIVFWAVAILFCAGGIVLIVLGYHKYTESREFVAGANSAEGKVVGFEKWDAPGMHIREGIHYAVVLYTTGDGREVRFRGPSKDGLVKLKQDDTVRVLYEPFEPEVARVDSFMGLWFAATMLWVVGSGAIVIPLLTLWQALNWVKRQETRHEKRREVSDVHK